MPPGTANAPNLPDPQVFQAEVQRQAQQIAFNKECDAVAAKGQAEYQDFPKAMQEYVALGGLTQPFLEAVLATDEPHKVLYELSKDKDKAFSIISLPPVRQAVEIAKFAGKLSSSGNAPTPVVRGTSAPEPISPKVGSRQVTAGGEVRLDKAGEVPISDWIAARNKDLKTRGVRI